MRFEHLGKFYCGFAIMHRAVKLRDIGYTPHIAEKTVIVTHEFRGGA